jgi:hypothetical protein
LEDEDTVFLPLSLHSARIATEFVAHVNHGLNCLIDTREEDQGVVEESESILNRASLGAGNREVEQEALQPPAAASGVTPVVEVKTEQEEPSFSGFKALNASADASMAEKGPESTHL